MQSQLEAGGEEADEIRRRLMARMGDVSEYMKTVKQRFSVWYNRNHGRYGTLWADRFKSVLVEGVGNPLQTMAAYIDLNPVRAGIADDPKDYRFCGYGEAVAGEKRAKQGLLWVWQDRVGKSSDSAAAALKAHRMLIFGKAASPLTHKGVAISREKAVKVLEEEEGELSKTAMLHCRVRYFTDGAIFGSAEFVRGFMDTWQAEAGRKHLPKVNAMRGEGWGDLAVIRSLRRQIFS